MSIVGRLEDANVGEVMQFIYLGQRSGRLLVEHGTVDSELLFKSGKIVFARGARQRSLGMVLAASGMVEALAIEETLAKQEEGARRIPLGRLLVGEGFLSEEQLRNAIELHILMTVLNMLGWSQGTFRFEIEEDVSFPDAADSAAFDFPEVEVDTQFVLLEAMRLQDEKARRCAEASEADGKPSSSPAREAPQRQPSSGSVEPEPVADLGPASCPASGGPVDDERVETAFEVDQDPAGSARLSPAADAEDAGGSAVQTRSVAVVTRDQELGLRLGRGLRSPTILVEVVEDPDQITVGGANPLLVLDDEMMASPSAPNFLKRKFPGCRLLVLTDQPNRSEELLESGAIATAPRSGSSAIDWIRELLDLADASEESEERLGGDAARMVQVAREIRSGPSSAALVFLKILSEYASRGALFMVREARLSAIGGFGTDTLGTGRRFTETLYRLRFSLDGDTLFPLALASGETQRVDHGRDRPRSSFLNLVGRPKNGVSYLFPIRCSDQIQFVAYIDNGDVEGEIGAIPLLEVAAIQAGLSIENQVLRRRLSKGRPVAHAVGER